MMSWKKLRFQKLKILQQHGAYALSLEDRNGNLWVGTTMGLFKFGKSEVGNDFIYFKNDALNPQTISGDFITSIEEDRQGNIWVGTHTNGVNKYDSRTGLFKRFLHQPSANSIINNNIRKLLVDKEGRLWVGTQEGISVLDDQGNSLYSFQQNDENAESLSQNSVHSLYQDVMGNIWAGTYLAALIIPMRSTHSSMCCEKKISLIF